jgi:hypothetical protein
VPAVPRPTFAALKKVLLGLGFEEKESPGPGVVFRHAGSDALVILHPYKANEVVDLAEIVGIRRLLDEKGVIPREEFDELLRARSLAS